MVSYITKGRGPNRRVIPIKDRGERVTTGKIKCRPGYHRVNGRCVRSPLKMRTTRIEHTTKIGWENGPVVTKEKKVVEEIKDG